MRAGCYVRKSSPEEGREADRKSVAHQATEARAYATRKGWTFDDKHVYQDDAVSGASFDRPGLSALLAALSGKKPPFDVLIVSEQSRLGRDTIRTLALIQTITDSGVVIRSYLDDREISVGDEMGEVEGFMKSWAASQERRKAGQRSRSVKARNAASGRPTGKRLYGYTVD